MTAPAQRTYVNHPRFGDQPIPSGHVFSEEQINNAHWRYASLRFFKETAIPADTSKQNFALYPRSLYVDIERECEACGRWFLFFALEQQYWFEHLGFWIDADCPHCVECRKDQQAIKKMQMDYQRLVNKPDLSEEERHILRTAAQELFQLGYIRDPKKSAYNP